MLSTLMDWQKERHFCLQNLSKQFGVTSIGMLEKVWSDGLK
jgi:hypothetical protein